jgi:hypothetical protein
MMMGRIVCAVHMISDRLSAVGRSRLTSSNAATRSHIHAECVAAADLRAA